MMDLKMEVYTPALELVGILEVHRSIIWEEKAFGAGSFSVDALITQESKALLIPDNIIWIAGETAGIIEYVQEQSGKDGPYITVKGPDLTGILEQRILWGQYNLTGTAPSIMHRLVTDCCISPTRGDVEARKIPGLVSLTPAAGGDKVQYQKTGGTLLEALEELGAAFGVAFGVRFDPATPRMEFWTRWGYDRSVSQTANDPVFYSTELDDVLSSEYSYNAQDYRNVALVAGEGDGSDRVMVTVEADVQPTPTPPEPVTKYTITLSVDPAGGGVASGGGQVNEGQSVTVTATPSSGYTFSGWRENGTTVSTNPSYTFTASADRSLTAVFAAVVPTYTITATIDPEGSGTVTGAGQYQEGDTVTLTATVNDGYTFTGWQENGAVVSTDNPYTFTATGDRAFTAAFAEKEKGLAYYGTIATLNVAMQYLSATTVGNYALFGGGYTGSARSDVVTAYDDTLTRTNPTGLSTARNLLAATTVGNYALFGGGYTGSARSNAVDAYNDTLTRTTPTPLSTARNSLAATTVGNYALFGGGSTSNTAYSSVVNAYDDTLTRTNPTGLSKARNSLAATTVGNYALFGGGLNAATSSAALSVVDAYNDTLTRTTPTPLRTARGYLAATTVGTYALFGGGFSYSSAVDAYNDTLTRTTPTPLSTARNLLAATTVGNYALFGGGSNASKQFSAVDAYDDTLTYATPEPLSVAKTSLAASTVGNFALFGGGYTGATSDVVDVYTIS